jgi:hypothetical protein
MLRSLSFVLKASTYPYETFTFQPRLNNLVFPCQKSSTDTWKVCIYYNNICKRFYRTMLLYHVKIFHIQWLSSSCGSLETSIWYRYFKLREWERERFIASSSAVISVVIMLVRTEFPSARLQWPSHRKSGSSTIQDTSYFSPCSWCHRVSN